MKRLIVVLAILTASAAGQSATVRDQEACYDQAKKVAEKEWSETNFQNHFDGKTCWLRVNIFRERDPKLPSSATHWVYVENAFENRTVAYCSNAKEPMFSVHGCNVEGKRYRSMSEFEDAITRRYGL